MTTPPWIAPVSAVAAAALAAAAAAAAIDVDEAAFDARATQLRVAGAVSAGAPDAFATVIAAIEERLARSPRFAIVRGLPASVTALFVAISARLGAIDAHHGSFLRQIRPATDREHGGRALNTLLHTDSTDWPVPNDLTCLWCVRPDPAGGRSRLLTADDFVAHVEAAAGADAAALLATGLPWRLAPELGGAAHLAPIARGGEVRWMRYTIESSALARDAVAALAAIERVTELAGGVIEETLRSGDLLVVDNRRTLHGRAQIADRGSPRLLLRTKLRRTSDHRESRT